MMYEKAEIEVRNTDVAVNAEAKPLAPTQDDTIDALVELHCQLSGLTEFLFGDTRQAYDRPEIKCFEDAVINCNHMTKGAVERIIMIKKRLGA